MQDVIGMRPVDLLAFRIDDSHKAFLKEHYPNEKNFRIKKCFETFSWGRAEDLQLGYPTLRESQRAPK